MAVAEKTKHRSTKSSPPTTPPRKASQPAAPSKSSVPVPAPTKAAAPKAKGRSVLADLVQQQNPPKATSSRDTTQAVFGAGKSKGAVIPVEAPAPKGGQSKIRTVPATFAALQTILGGSGLDHNGDAFKLTVTPKLADEILKVNVSNRFLALSQCRRHAQAMIEGKWNNDGNPLKFNTKGKFMDGQHRLTAVIMANMSIEFDVRVNLPPETQATMDTGRRRSVADQLTINQEPYAKVLAGTIGWIYRLCFDDMSYRIETPETLDFLDRNPKIRDSVAFVAGGSQTVKGTVSTLLAALHFIATNVLDEGENANKFVEVFRSGYPAYQGDPAHRLREQNMRLMNLRQLRTDKSSADHLIYVWNIFRQGKSARSMDVKTSQQIEGFKPEMIGISTDRDYDVEKTTLPMGQTIERRIGE